MSIGVLSKCESSKFKFTLFSSLPTTAYGAFTLTNCVKRCHVFICNEAYVTLLRFVTPDLKWAHARLIVLASRRLKIPPRSPSSTSSGSAFEIPPRATSWMNAIGFASPSCQQRSITATTFHLWSFHVVPKQNRDLLKKNLNPLKMPHRHQGRCSLQDHPERLGLHLGSLSSERARHGCYQRPPASMIGLW